MVSVLKYLKFAPRAFLKNGVPLQLIFFVTSQCNLRCRHCFYWKELNCPGKKELTLKEIKKVARNSKLNLMWLCLTGGEPFLREDLAEIASAFCQYGEVANISIPTNAQLKERTFEAAEKMLELHPDTYISINVSLDGLEKTHDRIRGTPGAFARAVDTFWKLKDLKNRFPNFGLSVQTVVLSENQDELRNLYFFVRDSLKPDYMNLNLVRGSPTDVRLRDVNIRYYKELVDLMWGDVKSGKWRYFEFPFSKLALARNFVLYEYIAKTFREERRFLPCYSSKLSGVISEEGDVYPCEILEDAKIGNLREADYNVSKLWFSKRNRKLQERIAKGCFCTYECAMSVNTLFNPKLYLAFLRTLRSV